MTDEPTAKAIQVKLVLLGEAAVGKSSLVLRFVQDDFNENNSPTIGAAFLTQKCRLEDKVIKFEIWDTAGQERFHSLAPMYYRNAAAAVVVYDLTKASSLDKAKTWITELQRQANPNIVIALVGNKADLIDDNAPTGVALASGEEGTEGTELVSSPFAAKSSSEGEGGVKDEEDEGIDETSTTPAATTATATTANTTTTNARQVSKEEVEAYAREQGGILLFEASAKTGKGVQEVFTEIAKNLPIESMQSKPPGSNTGNAGNRRGAAGAAAGDSGRVNLGASAGGEAGKKSGGCC